MTDKTIDHRLAWLAGIIDGEGSVGLYLRKPTPAAIKWKADHQRMVSYRYLHPVVTITNTDEAMVLEIRAIGDVLGVRGALGQEFEPKHPTHRPHWRITFKSKAACDLILRATLPYLITKRVRAELVLRAIAHRRSFGGQKRGGVHGYVPVGDDSVLAEMLAEMKRLNRRGVPQEG